MPVKMLSYGGESKFGVDALDSWFFRNDKRLGLVRNFASGNDFRFYSTGASPDLCPL